MKVYQAEQIFNISILGHGGDGKTTLTEAMLYNAGVTDRLGRVDDGTAAMDYDSEETKRKISISAALAPIEWNQHKLNLMDVPGYFDFVGESVGPLRVSEGAVIVLSAVSGVVVGTEKAWDACKNNQVARMIVVNQMDRENANFSRVIDDLRARYGVAIAPVMIPIIEKDTFAGFIDLINQEAKGFGSKLEDIPIPSAMQADVDAMREMLVEAAAESSDELLEKFFSGESLCVEEIISGLRTGVAAGKVVPVLCCSGLLNLGVKFMADTIVNFMPSAASRKAIIGTKPQSDEAITRECAADKPFSAQVFKTIADPFVGKLSIFRVYSGSITPDMMVYDPMAEKQFKAGNLYLLCGKKQIPVEKLAAGDVGAVAKLQHTMTGHTLCDAANPIVLPPIAFPQPCISMAVAATKQGEEDKVFSGLHRLEEEDLTLMISKDSESGQMLINGLGELHIEVVLKKLKHKFGVEAITSQPQIPYRETIRKSVQAEGKHKKQSGGHGQYGHCWVEFQPITDGSSDFEFEDRVVGGVVPRQYIPAVEKGLREAVQKGVLAGYPVVGLRCILYDGSYHSVDSSEMAFKVAASQAFKKGLAMASPTLLEPIYHVEVLVTDENMGDIIGDLNRRRGRILGMNPVEGMQQVVAEVPLAEMYKYATDLRSMTQARGSFTMHFARYEDVPASASAQIIEKAKKDSEEEE